MNNNLLTQDMVIAHVFNLPAWAPFPKPFIAHLIGLPLTFESLRDSKPIFDRLDVVHPRLVEARISVFRILSQLSVTQSMRIDLFRQALAEILQKKQQRLQHELDPLKPIEVHSRKHYSISDPTLADFRRRHLLLPSPRRGEGMTDNLGTILLAALLDSRVQNFLPPVVEPLEPRWWCYAQLPPTVHADEHPIITLPYPLPAGLPAATVVWTPWPTFDTGWLQLGEAGAIRFAGVSIGKKNWKWLISRKEAALWDPDLANPDMALLTGSMFGHHPSRTELENLLRRLAAGKLG